MGALHGLTTLGRSDRLRPGRDAERIGLVVAQFHDTSQAVNQSRGAARRARRRVLVRGAEPSVALLRTLVACLPAGENSACRRSFLILDQFGDQLSPDRTPSVVTVEVGVQCRRHLPSMSARCSHRFPLLVGAAPDTALRTPQCRATSRATRPTAAIRFRSTAWAGARAVDVSGELDIAGRDLLTLLLAGTEPAVVVDMSKLVFMDCGGYAAIVEARRGLDLQYRTVTFIRASSQRAHCSVDRRTLTGASEQGARSAAPIWRVDLERAPISFRHTAISAPEPHNPVPASNALPALRGAQSTGCLPTLSAAFSDSSRDQPQRIGALLQSSGTVR